VNRSAGVEAAGGAGAGAAAVAAVAAADCADGAKPVAVERAVAAAARTAVDAAADGLIDGVGAGDAAAGVVAADAVAAPDAIGGRIEVTADDPAVGMLVAGVEDEVAARPSFGSELDAPARTGQFGHRGAGALVGELVWRPDAVEVVVEAVVEALVEALRAVAVDGVAEGTELPAEPVGAAEGAVSAGRRARAAAGVRTSAVVDAARTAADGGAWKVGQFGHRGVLGAAGVAGAVVLLAGKGAGRLKGDRHIAAPRATPLANAMLDIAQKYGAEIGKLGVSTGKLEI
jgi:hypothetical protein